MGFRSMVISEDTGLVLQDWFVEKWKTELNFTGGSCFSTHREIKIRFFLEDLILDLQKVIAENANFSGLFKFIIFYENGNVARVTVGKDVAGFAEAEWQECELSELACMYM